jgi:hypothetical protein
MQSVDFVHGWWVLRACGRNPLVRGIDRLELLIISLGILVVLVAAACSGALGTAVHDARSSVYTAQAQTRRTVIARAIDDSTIVFGDDEYPTARVNARWQANGSEHTASFTMPQDIKTGDSLRIWVDANGNSVDAPTPTSQAGVDAVGVAYTAWLTMALAAAGLICLGRSRLKRQRDSAWEREIRCLVDDDSGRKP